MKNSATTTATVVMSSKKEAFKKSLQESSVDIVKIIVYPAHLVCQTAADLLNIAQAKAINLIDDTPVFQSMHEQSSWTQDKQAYVVGKGMAIRERILAQRESNRQQDIAKHQARIDSLNGIEHMDKATVVASTVTTTEPIVVSTEPKSLTTEPTVVPAPPVEAPFVPINKRAPKATKELPTMTPAQAFVVPTPVMS